MDRGAVRTSRRLSRVRACVAVAAFCITVSAANAQADTLERVRSAHRVACGSIIRPGLAVPSADGKRWAGLAVEICRAVAAAVLGDPDAILLHAYVGPARTASAPDDQIAFVTAQTLLDHGLTDRLATGPVVLHDAEALLVPGAGAANLAGLAGKTICVEPGSAADRALVATFARRHLALGEHPFQEPDEMREAYTDGDCDALAGPMTTLANLRADPEEGHASDRILPDLLSLDSIMAATPADDARWSAVVGWTFAALVEAEADATAPCVPPRVGASLGLDPGWAGRAVAAVGSYGAIYDRTLGAHSKLKLERGPNRLWRDGGLIYTARAD